MATTDSPLEYWSDEQLLKKLYEIHDRRYMRHKCKERDEPLDKEMEEEIIYECAKREIFK